MFRTKPQALQDILTPGIPEKERKHPDEDNNPSCLGSWLTEAFQHTLSLACSGPAIAQERLNDWGQAVTYLSLSFFICKLVITI